MIQTSGYLGLMLAAFLAATLFPFQSEALLVALMTSEHYSAFGLIVFATVGNVAGSWVNWLLGRSIERFRNRRWFPFKPSTLEAAQRRYGRFGYWSLLLSWMPVIGDPLTLIAGMMREPLWRFLLIVSIAKAGRYMAIALFAVGWFG